MNCHDVDAWILGDDRGRGAARRVRRHLGTCARCASEYEDVAQILEVAASPAIGRGTRLLPVAVAVALILTYFVATSSQESQPEAGRQTPPVTVPEGRRREVVVDGPGVIAWSGSRATASPPTRIVYTFTSERFASSR